MSMSPWTLAFVLVVALLTGFACGWWLLKSLGVRSPNAWVTMIILLAGAVGGPAVTYALMGPRPLSYIVALLAAGFTAGATFWPMSKPQGTREWL